MAENTEKPENLLVEDEAQEGTLHKTFTVALALKNVGIPSRGLRDYKSCAPCIGHSLE